MLDQAYSSIVKGINVFMVLYYGTQNNRIMCFGELKVFILFMFIASLISGNGSKTVFKRKYEAIRRTGKFRRARILIYEIVSFYVSVAVITSQFYNSNFSKPTSSHMFLNYSIV